ncbi:MAG: AAA family ATPase [Solirubrobacterales bacterium]|nr:AAA family ATPase [Solirubrobacterales bacterium]
MGLFSRRSRKSEHRGEGRSFEPAASRSDLRATDDERGVEQLAELDVGSSGVGVEQHPPPPEPKLGAATEHSADAGVSPKPAPSGEPVSSPPGAEPPVAAEQALADADDATSEPTAPPVDDWWGDAANAEWFDSARELPASVPAPEAATEPEPELPSQPAPVPEPVADLIAQTPAIEAEKITVSRATDGPTSVFSEPEPELEPGLTSAPVSDPASDPETGPDGSDRLLPGQALSPKRVREIENGSDGEDGVQARRCQVISFANQKGGVAKTTTTLNLAVAFAESGHRVLVVDLDPQGNLTMSQGIDPDRVERSMYDVLVHHMPIKEIIQKREIDVAVASIDLAGAEIAMSTQIGRERSLEKALSAVLDDYDYVCIDTPPSLGLLTINALTASDKVIVPVQCEYLSMRGLVQLQNTLEMIRENLNPRVEIEGILPTMLDSRTVHAKEAVEILEENFGELVFKSRIRKAIKFAEAPVRGSSVLKYDPRGNAANCYRELAREVLTNDAS